MNFAATLQDTTYSLKDGLIVSCLPVRHAEFVHITFTLRGGAGLEQVDQLGYFSLLGTMLSRGCGELDRAAFAEDCDKRGANVNIYPGRDYLTIEIWALPSDLEWALRLIVSMIWDPRLEEAEVSTARDESIAQLLARQDEKRSRLFDEARRRLFPENHNYARPLLGDADCLMAVTAGKLRSFQERITAQMSAVLCATGQFQQATLDTLIENQFSSLAFCSKSVTGQTVDFVHPERTGFRIGFPVEQAEVLIALPAVGRLDPDYRLALFCNEILGGAFLSRLTRAVRMQEGLAYSADSRLRAGTEAGLIWIGLQTDVRNTELALRTVRACLDELLHEGVGETEYTHFKDFVSSSMLFDYDALASLTSRRLEQILFREPWPLESRLTRFSERVTPERVGEMFQRLIRPEKALVCLLGRELPREVESVFFAGSELKDVAPPLSLIPAPIGPSGRPPSRAVRLSEHPAGELYRMPSGHHLLTLPRPGLGSISLQLWTVTGSMDEKHGQTGLSHLLEHLMFRGTKQFPDGSFDAILAQKGGLNNAFTSEDFTVYTDYVTVEGLEEALCLEADRFQALDISEELFQTERSVVMEERSVRVDCSPLGKAYEKLQTLALGDHPYGHPVIGWREDLENVELAAVQSHYRMASEPGRLLIVVAGGCSSTQAVELVERCFSERMDGSSEQTWPVLCSSDPVPALKPASIHMNERSGYSYLLLCYRFPREGHPDYEACELLSRVVGDGDSCRLYDRFVRKDKKFLEVWTSYESQARDHPLLHLGLASPAENEQISQESASEILEFLDDLDHRLTQDELDKARVSWLAEEAFGTDELEDWALEIAGRVVLLPWDQVWNHRERIESVTLAKLKEVAERYLAKEKCVYVSLQGDSEEVD